MDRPQLMAIVIALMVVLLVLMYLGWRARRRRQSGIAAPAVAPTERGAEIGSFEGKYVATTASGDPYDRVAVHGLGFRASASVSVAEKGILLELVGAPDVWIPRGDVRGIRTATWTIDRVVEQEGLDLVEWMLGDKQVDSYFRMEEPARFENAVHDLLERKAS